jgi:hypothetical protein
MKKILVTLALAVAIVTSGFATDVIKVDKRVQAAFEKEFASAFNPTWEIVGENLYHVTFTQNGAVMDAYYNEEAELVTLARFVSKDQLPLLVSKTIDQKFNGYIVNEIRELVTNDETSYLITARKVDATVIARVYTTGGLQIVKKIKNVKQ